MLFKKDTPENQAMPTIMAEMLISKLVHDLASPVGAVENGLELVSDDLQGDFAEEALGMVKTSAATVASRLKIYRIAYGTTSGVTGYYLQSLIELLQNFFRSEKRLNLKPGNLPSDITDEEKKLFINCVLCAADALPRGGDIVVEQTVDSLIVKAVSQDATHPPKEGALIIDNTTTEDLSAYTVQAHYTGWYAESKALTLNKSLEGATLSISISK